MSDAAIVGLVVWLSLVGLAVALLVTRTPQKRRTPDEWEATVAALKNRVIDLEDKHESFVKRQAVRSGRQRADEVAVPSLPFDRATRLAAVRQRAAALRNSVGG